MLGRSVSRLTFPSSPLFSLGSFLKAIKEEFSIVEGNPFIVQLVLRGVTSALGLFLTKAGELVRYGWMN